MSSSGGGAVFAYGSLVDPDSAALTLGAAPRAAVPATLSGWRRGFTQARDNRACEKTFALDAGGALPDYILGLNISRSGAHAVNGVLIELSAEELARLDRRELRYDRLEVSAEVRPAEPVPAPVYAYVAKPEHLALEPPPGAVILAAYAAAVEAAFAALGADQLAAYRESVRPLPAPVVAAHLIRDTIPPGNPRRW